MKLIDKEYCWQSDDDAKVCFSKETANSIPIPKPTHIAAVHECGYSHSDGIKEIPIEELEYLCSVQCEARGGSIQWNSNTQLGAYTWHRPHGKPALVLWCFSGLGLQWMWMDQLELYNSFIAILGSGVPSIVIWDLLQSWFHTYACAKRLGVNETTQEYRNAFVSGRLQKKKKRGQDLYEVKIIPEVTSV